MNVLFLLYLHDAHHSVTSPIDGKSMESINSIKILHGPEYKANEKVIRWTEVSSSSISSVPKLGYAYPQGYAKWFRGYAGRTFDLRFQSEIKPITFSN